ncbi:MAG: VWA domain-containing protein [Planctomycetaceae bacterium]|nr:VWA domain-containing protein [Planctomycetaceae bacterium]
MDYRITFESPWYLLLLLVIPVLWWFSYRGLAPLGRLRRFLALSLRTAILLAFIAALADVQMVRISNRLTVIYLLDQSMSIPVEHRRAMMEYVNDEIRKHRRDDDRAGVIVFGREAAIEVPPFNDDVQLTPLIESLIDQEFTNLSAAIRLAQASFPEDAAKRIVVVSDGNENLGDALKQAQHVASDGVGIDVVPIRYDRRGEVILDRVAVPGNVRKGHPFDLRVVLTNLTEATPEDDGVVSGTLVIRRGDDVVSEDKVALAPGKQVFSVRQEVDDAGFHRYEAKFLPENPEDDAMRQNNAATSFSYIRGKGQVLLIEDSESPGEFDRMVQALKRQNIEVDVRSGDLTFTGLDQLQQFDTVVLANVPREAFTDAQIEMLVRNTQQLGAGLVMMGAPNGFGAGGWTNTSLEKAMPVDFQIKAAKVVPRGALVMMMHASEMAQGNFWQKKIAEEALKALGPQDYCGVLHYDNMASTKWLWNPGMATVGPNRSIMLGRLGRMDPGDMPQFDPAMRLAQQGFAGLPDAAVKHMIVISDGDPTPPSAASVRAIKDLNVTVSTVAVGTHGPAGSGTLRDLAKETGGKYYAVKSPNALPKIFQREARRVAQPLIYENAAGVVPETRFPHEMIRGIDGPFPPITGYVMTTKKENPLVEVSLVSPLPGTERNRTILASWTYGLGRAVAYTTDVGARYATQWTGWENYDKFFTQMIIWSMRPLGDEGKFSISTEERDGQIEVVVNALDKNDDFYNFLAMTGTVVGPNLEPVELKMQQTAPGRYQGSFAGRDAGSYFIVLSPGPGMAPLQTGINVPYSDEFRSRETNEALLGQLPVLEPKGGKPGRLLPPIDEFAELKPLLEYDTFRHDLAKAFSSQDIWFLVVLLAAWLLFLDVFVRRVQVNFAWVPVLAGRIAARLFGREQVVSQVETIDRLRSRKAEVAGQVDQLRATSRFEATQPITGDQPIDLAAPPPESLETTGQAPSLAEQDKPEEETYTSRLLKAKKKAWKDKGPQ